MWLRGDWYTEFEVVEQVNAEPNAYDPLTTAGFYHVGTSTQIVARDEFQFGVFPTSAGILDKHALSVKPIVVPAWALTPGLLWHRRRRRISSGTTSLSDPD